jgi:hypothetical protein
MGRGSGVAIDLGTPGSSSMNMQLGNRTRTEWGPRQRALVRARARFNAALPREGRIARQSRRCLLARQGVASLRELREWCYPSRERRHWHQTNIYRALRKLGARRIGWGMYAL